MKEASTVFLAAPVEQTLHMLDELAASGIRKKLLITDVGSTKQKVVTYAEKVLPDEYRFIGAIRWPDRINRASQPPKTSFSRTRYILTPSGSAGKEAVASLKDLLKGTNAKFVEMSPAEHDAVTSVISHFPHVVAASLVHQTVKFEDHYPLVKRFAAGASAILRELPQAARRCGAIFFCTIKIKYWNGLTNGNLSWTESSLLSKMKMQTGCLNFFGKPRNTATVCLCGKKARFLPFTIFMSMSPTIPGSSRNYGDSR